MVLIQKRGNSWCVGRAYYNTNSRRWIIGECKVFGYKRCAEDYYMELSIKEKFQEVDLIESFL